MWSLFVDRLVSSSKLLRKYFSLWVFNTSLFGNTNASHFLFMASVCLKSCHHLERRVRPPQNAKA